MVKLNDSYKWTAWDNHQNNSVADIFDDKYNWFKHGEICHEQKAKAKEGNARFQTILQAPQKQQLTSTDMWKASNITGVWDWQGPLYGQLVNLKVNSRYVDLHVDAGHRNFFNNNLETNLFWGFNIPAGIHPRDAWQWSWKGGMISQMQIFGWNMIGVSDFRMAPNATKKSADGKILVEGNTGPGNIGFTDRYCLTKDEHTIHSNLQVETDMIGKFKSKLDGMYLYKGGDWASYCKGTWDNHGKTIPEVSWGASYLAHKTYANLAYRFIYNTQKNTVEHTLGLGGKCNDSKVNYKAHVTFEGANTCESVKKVDASETVAPKHKSSLHMYHEHKCTANFLYKAKVEVDLMNPSAWKWGAIFSSST